MTYVQAITPNVDIQGRLGWCLEYVQKCYGLGWAGSSAWDAWTNRVADKHSDRNFPSGVAFPVWFDGLWQGERLGHVGIYKDGQVFCSPYRNGQKYAVLKSIQEVERIYRMKYVGWSEDLAGTKLIKKEQESMTQSEAEKVVTYLYRLGTQDYPSPGQAEYWVPRVKNTATGVDELGGEMLKGQVVNKPGEAEKKLQAIKDALK